MQETLESGKKGSRRASKASSNADSDASRGSRGRGAPRSFEVNILKKY